MTKRQILLYVVIAFIVIVVFQIIGRGIVLDPDTFYHLRVTHMIIQHGPLHDFQWLQFTIFKLHYIDHHFLFHILLIPFIVFNDWLGLSAFLVFQAMGLIAITLVMTKKVGSGIVRSLVLAPLFFSAPFLFILNVGRAQIMSAMILMLGTHFIIERKWKLALLTTVLYTLAYNGFVLLLIPMAIYIFYNLILNKKFEWKILLSVLVGMVLGTLIHPNFPWNVSFYYQHIINIGVIPLPIPKGVGWLPYNVKQFFFDNLVIVLLFFSAGAIFVSRIKTYKDQLVPLLTFLTIAVAFLSLLFRSQLFVVYFIPFAVLFVMFVFGEALKNISLKYIKDFLISTWQFNVSIILIAVISLYGMFLTMTIVYGYIRQSPRYDRYELSARWLKNNSETGDIVFNLQWDYFPQLFYWDQKNNFINGLDPVFMYEYDAQAYAEWQSLSDENSVELNAVDLHGVIKNEFYSKYVFLEKERNPLINSLLDQDSKEGGVSFSKTYEDDIVAIYKVR